MIAANVYKTHWDIKPPPVMSKSKKTSLRDVQEEEERRRSSSVAPTTNEVKLNGLASKHGKQANSPQSLKIGKRRGWTLRRKAVEAKENKKKWSKNEVRINIPRVNVDYDNNDCCETEMDVTLTDQQDMSSSEEDVNNKGATRVDKTLTRQSTFNEKLTPMGRVLMPVRREGEPGCGYNSLFISPKSDLPASGLPFDETACFCVKKWFSPATSHVNMKIFGGSRGIAKEQERMKSAGFLIHPYSSFRRVLFVYSKASVMKRY